MLALVVVDGPFAERDQPQGEGGREQQRPRKPLSAARRPSRPLLVARVSVRSSSMALAIIRNIPSPAGASGRTGAGGG